MSAQPQRSFGGVTAPTGTLGLTVIRGNGDVIPIDPRRGFTPAAPVAGFERASQIPMREYAHHFMPHRGLTEEVNEWRVRNLRHIRRGVTKVGLAKVHGIATMYGALWLKVLRGDGEEVDLGLASLQVVTTAGVTYICADIAGGANDSNLFKFHGFGTGTNSEASGDTTLQTELTTQYAVDSTRPTGSQSASTNTYTTVGTLSPDANVAITEHGIFTATSSGTLLDRSVFSVVNLVGSADSLQATYVLTLAAGG